MTKVFSKTYVSKAARAKQAARAKKSATARRANAASAKQAATPAARKKQAAANQRAARAAKRAQAAAKPLGGTPGGRTGLRKPARKKPANEGIGIMGRIRQRQEEALKQ